MKATRGWFRQECAKYGIVARRNNGSDIFEVAAYPDDYPWVHAPPLLPGQVWVSGTGSGAVLCVARIEDAGTVWSGTERTTTSQRLDPSLDDLAVLVWGPRAPWCSKKVWEEK